MAEDIIIKSFDSPLEFLEWASNAPLAWRENNCASRRISRDKTEWTGTKDYDEAYQLAKFGWREGLQLLTQKVTLANAALASKIAPTGKQKRYDVAGLYPHPARAAAGEIFSMVQPLRPRSVENERLVKIRYDIGRLADVRTDTIITMGAALCSYINALEQSNHIVHLDTYSEHVPSEYSGPNLSLRFPLKKAGYNLSMADMVFWLVHPSAFRRIQFSAMERLDIENGYAGGYGRSRCITQPSPDTLYLRIDDAGRDVNSCLESIRRKHVALLKPQSVLKLRLESLRFGS